MDDLCSIGERELAQFCCVCKYPLLLFCEEHISEHASKSGFHFILPVSARTNIPSREALIQLREWLNRLNYTFDTLREKVEEFSRNEEKIDAVYSELQQYVFDTRTRLKEQLSTAKTYLRAAVESAIKEVREHVMEAQSFVPENYFSQLIWYYDTSSVAASQFYYFQANWAKESMDSVFQVALQFTVPGFEQWNIGQITQTPSERIEELMKALALKDETHNYEAKTDELSQQALNLAKIQTEVKEKTTELENLRRDTDLRISALEKDLTSASKKIATLEQRCFDMDRQLKEKDEALRPKPNIAPVLPSSHISAAPLEKLIAVYKCQVKCFDWATNEWQQLSTLRSEIAMCAGTSSAIIAPNKVFLCNGCNCYLAAKAFILDRDGSVQKLPDMPSARVGAGIIWDSGKKALYVFGGYNGGICYQEFTAISEMFLNTWSSLARMHKGRAYFNPCWYSSLVYLCGGTTTSVETYNPRSNTFVLQDFYLPDSGETTTVVESGVLIVISTTYISKVKQGRLTSQHCKGDDPWSQCTPLVSGGVVYIVNFGPNYCYCRGVDLESGVAVGRWEVAK